MPLIRPFLLLFTIFCFAGVSSIFAQEKVAKAKVTRQPSSVTVQFGQSATFTVQHNAGSDVTYQWRHNKRPLPDANEASYTITTVFTQDAGKYDVVITNSRGATTSKAATLTVNLAPASLPLDAVLYGEFVLRAYGQNIESDGAFVVSGPSTFTDPENPSDTYNYTYSRLPKNKARLVINGRFFDSDLGAYVTSLETYSLVFIGVAPGGQLVAAATAKGTYFAPPGYKPSKIKFTAKGAIAIEGAELYNFVPYSGGSLGGSVSIGNGNNTIPGNHDNNSAAPIIIDGDAVNLPDGPIHQGPPDWGIDSNGNLIFTP